MFLLQRLSIKNPSRSQRQPQFHPPAQQHLLRSLRDQLCLEFPPSRNLLQHQHQHQVPSRSRQRSRKSRQWQNLSQRGLIKRSLRLEVFPRPACSRSRKPRPKERPKKENGSAAGTANLFKAVLLFLHPLLLHNLLLLLLMFPNQHLLMFPSQHLLWTFPSQHL